MRKAGRDTKTELVEAARGLFARSGFEGVSIAQIASELGVTKQALLHHFGSKEKLFAIVMKALAERLNGLVAQLDANDGVADRLQTLCLSIHRYYGEEPLDAHLVLRELLDQSGREQGQKKGRARTWYLADFLEALIDYAAADKQLKGLSRPQVFAHIYQIIAVGNYFAVSRATLRGIYGSEGFEPLYRAMTDLELGQ